ncbi:hypothetical protein [Tateyamaria sp.]|uniref:hypothetical protein n=1 Tax=Tateyamaria sp. TaxID=1929288 RepID=UPI00329C8F49
MKYSERGDDDQLGYDQYEDVLAYAIQNEFFGLKLGTDRLSELDMTSVGQVASELVENQEFQIDCSSGLIRFELSEGTFEIEEYLGHLPGVVEVWESVDDSPAHSASWPVFLIDGTAKEETLRTDIEKLCERLGKFEKQAHQLLGF